MKTKIIVQKTTTTPLVEYATGVLKITGNSFPFEPESFWPMIIHYTNKLENITVEVNLEHINTDSLYYLLNLLKSKSVSNIKWFCNDEDDLETFNLIEGLVNKNFTVDLLTIK